MPTARRAGTMLIEPIPPRVSAAPDPIVRQFSVGPRAIPARRFGHLSEKCPIPNKNAESYNVKCHLTDSASLSYLCNVALLRLSELRPWLLQRYGSASTLAAALGVTRQTAHNLLTGRTLPSYENCAKFGLSPAFVVQEGKGTREMTSLDNYLVQREQDRRSAGLLSDADLNATLIGPRGAAMIRGLIRATYATAARIGTVDGIRFEWDDGQSGGSVSPLLKLQPVGAQFKPVMSSPAGRTLRGYRIDFGWVATHSGQGAKELPGQRWRLTLALCDGVLGWNVNKNEIVNASSIELAEQIVKRLIEYWDEYEKSN